MIDFGNPNGKWPFKVGRGFTTEEKMSISDAKVAADKAVIAKNIKMIDQMHRMPIMRAKSTKIFNKLDILPKLNAKEVSTNTDQKIGNKQSNNTPKLTEEKMPVSDAKIADDKAVIAKNIKMIDQVHKMPIVRAKSTKIFNKVDSLPKLDAKEVTISNAQKIANKQPNKAPKKTEIKMPISDAKSAADNAVTEEYIKKTDQMQQMPLVDAKSTKNSNKLGILPKLDAKEVSISIDEKIGNKQPNNAPKSDPKIAIKKKKDASGKNSIEEKRKTINH
ncbi:hypothetical protein niasHT_038870 [Heterodera trifolii]|uniref:Uncharacterized protein n=1 Tax=Heterodera trifolii TaxID=157864 RepID=A0ABD2J3X6_9BILA